MEKLKGDEPTNWGRLKARVFTEKEVFGGKVLHDRWDVGYWRAMELVHTWMEEIDEEIHARERERE